VQIKEKITRGGLPSFRKEKKKEKNPKKKTVKGRGSAQKAAGTLGK